jgi:hypothetical protein
VVVELIAPTTVDATIATELVALSGFADPSHDLTISDLPSFLISSTATAAEMVATSVTIPADETASVATIYRLTEVPNFTAGAHHLLLSANAVANDAMLAAIGNLGSSYEPNGHSLTMTQDDTTLTQAQYTALQSDNVVTNGHAFSAVVVEQPLNIVSSAYSGVQDSVEVTAIGGDDYFVIDGNGNVATNVQSSQDPYTPSANDVTWTDEANTTFSFVDVANGQTYGPVIDLDVQQISQYLTAQGTPASQVQLANSVHLPNVGYLPLINTYDYTSNVSTPSLVYASATHQLVIEVPGGHAGGLIILGGGPNHVYPSSLTTSEFTYKN